MISSFKEVKYCFVITKSSTFLFTVSWCLLPGISIHLTSLFFVPIQLSSQCKERTQNVTTVSGYVDSEVVAVVVYTIGIPFVPSFVNLVLVYNAYTVYDEGRRVHLDNERPLFSHGLKCPSKWNTQYCIENVCTTHKITTSRNWWQAKQLDSRC